MPAAARPAGLAQPFEHMSVVFRPEKREATSDMPVEGGRRDCDGLFKRRLCLCRAAELAERCGKPTVRNRPIGARAGSASCRLDRGLIVSARIIRESDGQQLAPLHGLRGSSLKAVSTAARPSLGRPRKLRTAPFVALAQARLGARARARSASFSAPPRSPRWTKAQLRHEAASALAGSSATARRARLSAELVASPKSSVANDVAAITRAIAKPP
jgi:hypothetical protein